MPKQKKVLLVEDEELTQKLLKAFMETEGFSVAVANDGAEMFSRLDREAFDTILLDLGLPGEDGLALLRQLRMVSDIPVIVVSSRNQRPDRLTALELGADDYLGKPFDPQELVLRARNLIHRAAAQGGSATAPPAGYGFEFNGWRLDLNARSARSPSGEDITLTRSEFDILAALARSPNRVLSRAQLLDATAHFGNEPNDRTIDVLVSRLRRKIGAACGSAEFIVTVPGFGYRLQTRDVHG